ncbi:MAG TPA: hypothetical protein VJ302_01915 [Blastocatellia bacterium]|nr:hypothetical protein [Blastocatellia bacterium]
MNRWLFRRLTEGRQLNSILSFNTGAPFNLTAGYDWSLSGDLSSGAKRGRASPEA